MIKIIDSRGLKLGRFLVAVLVALMLVVVSLPQAAHAQTEQMLMSTGSYTGDGTDDRAITGVGFQPDVVFIKGDLAQVGVFRTSTMGDGYSKATGATALFTDRIKSFGADGFTIGTDVDVNKADTSYYWAAFKAAAGEMKVGSYTGDGNDDRSISGVGFQPDFIIVMSASGNAPVFRFSNVAGDVSYTFAGGNNSNCIQALEADGFQVGTNNKVNNNGTDYHYIAWKAVSGRIAVGSYTGDGTDDRSVTGVGFQPYWVIVHQQEGTPATRHKLASTPVDESQLFTATANKNNEIQALEADGFQVGSADPVNKAGNTYQYMALLNDPAPSYPERYKGGSGDGFTMLTSEVMTLGGPLARYAGGSGDGFTMLTSEVMTLGGPLARYAGGSGDGFTMLTSEVMTLGGPLARYAGGSGDGFAILESELTNLVGITLTPGDANWDGEINAADITEIGLIVAMAPGHPENPAADANEDGEINIFDVTKVEILYAEWLAG